MQTDNIIRNASFDPKVKTYWLVSGAIPFVITIIGIPLLLLWFPLGYVFTGRYLDRMACTLTNKALKVKKGVFVRVEKTIPLEKITDMAMVQGPLMRRFGVHRLTVETAGQSGAGALVALTGIVQAEDFRETVLDQRDAMMAKALNQDEGGSVRATSSTGDTGPDPALAELRDSVLRIEALLKDLSDRRGDY